MDPDEDNNNDEGVEPTPDQDEPNQGDDTDFPEVEENPDGSGSGGDDQVGDDPTGVDQGEVESGDNDPDPGGEETDAPPPYDPDVILDEEGNVIQAGGNNTSPLIVDIDGPDASLTTSEGNPAVSVSSLFTLDPLEDGELIWAVWEWEWEWGEKVNLLLGLLIVLGASALNAFGLNLTKLDHVRTPRSLYIIPVPFPSLRLFRVGAALNPVFVLWFT